MEMPTLVAIVTFEGLVAHGKHSGAALHGERKMPWSFNFFGYPVTHENDDRYIICRPDKENLNLYRGEVITVWSDGSLTVVSRNKETR